MCEVRQSIDNKVLGIGIIDLTALTHKYLIHMVSHAHLYIMEILQLRLINIYDSLCHMITYTLWRLDDS